jgi:hypothetical protein
MINMKKTEDMPSEYEDMDEPAYPYGLCLKLTAEDMDKLGITALPKVGSEMMIHAKAYVKATSAYETQGGQDMSISLQITDLDLDGIERQKDQAEAMYGKEAPAAPASGGSSMLYGGK